jgi:hypothetical protein
LVDAAATAGEVVDEPSSGVAVVDGDDDLKAVASVAIKREVGSR